MKNLCKKITAARLANDTAVFPTQPRKVGKSIIPHLSGNVKTKG